MYVNSRSSTKTPATTKVSSKASSMSKSSKSTVSTTGRKRAVESKVQDQTPRIKKDKQDSLDQKEVWLFSLCFHIKRLGACSFCPVCLSAKTLHIAPKPLNGN